jgi:transketolase
VNKEAAQSVTVSGIDIDRKVTPHQIEVPDFDRDRFDQVGFLTAMTLTLLGNYAQTGHFGGPLAYIPYVVTCHLLGHEGGGLNFDYRRPKHPYADRFMLAGGHNAPVTYALWMIMGEALARQYASSGDERYRVDPRVAMLSIDALGFRRGAGALSTPLVAQAKLRGIRALAGHSETTDLTNDVNGGPSGIGVATAAGKAAFWDIMGAPVHAPKIMAIEGEFAMTSGHSQEFKTQAVAQKSGKRLRVLLSYNNAGIDDELVGSVIPPEFVGYDIAHQWASYGWNVLGIDDANDYASVAAAFRAMEDWNATDRRPMILVGKTIKGWWPGAVGGEIPGYGKAIIDHASHPYAFPQNGDYFRALAGTFEQRFGIEFVGIHDGPLTDDRERLIQFKTNIDVALSILDTHGLGDWLAEQLVAIGDGVRDDLPLRKSTTGDPFQDPRLAVNALPLEPQTVTARNPMDGSATETTISLFETAGRVRGTRRAISEIFQWLNHITGNRFIAIAADLAESINIQHSALFGYFDPVSNPWGTLLKAGIQEAGNASTAIGLISQSASLDPTVHNGVWALSGTYGAFTPLMYLPARVFSQQNQDSPFRIGVLHILAGHSGPETAADARTHFGIFAPQVWKLFPKGHVITLNFWDYNDVAPAYFAAAQIAARDPKVGIIVLEVARPDFPVADREQFADPDIRAAAKGLYVVRNFEEGKPQHGYVLTQGSSSTVNLVKTLPRLSAAGINVKVIACVSEDLFDRQPAEYRDAVLPPGAKHDLMVVSTGTHRVMPISNVGPLTAEYSMFSDWDDQWLSGGTEADVIAEARLDPQSIFDGVSRFANEREARLTRQREALESLSA